MKSERSVRRPCQLCEPALFEADGSVTRRQARRQQKKQVREAFAGERKKQQRAEDRMASRRAADVGGHGTSVMSLS